MADTTSVWAYCSDGIRWAHGAPECLGPEEAKRTAPGAAHIELLRPSFGVDISDATHAVPRIVLKMSTTPFEVGHQRFNGMETTLPISEVHRLIKVLERGISLADVALRRAANPDDGRWKGNQKSKVASSFEKETSLRELTHVAGLNRVENAMKHT